MNTLKAMRMVDKSRNNQVYPEYEKLCEALEAGWPVNYEEFENRVKGFWLVKWLCTDTWVGTAVYYLDWDPICCAVKNCRKCDPHFFFVSKEAAFKMREFLLSLRDEDEPEFELIAKEIPDYYDVKFSGQLLVNEGSVDVRKCKITNTFREDYVSQKVEVEFEDGERKVVPVDEFKIPIHIQGE